MLSVTIEKRRNHFILNTAFDIHNEIVVLFGPSGSGKTTILNCIAGLTHPDKGKISLGERTLYQNKQQKPVPIHKRRIGYLFQDYALFPHMSVEKNIRYGMKDPLLVEQLIDITRIRPLLQQYPQQISGGEKQRVALVRALATKPEALLLDEPFSALDEKTRADCQNELKRLHDYWKIPVILVTHDKQEADILGDRILHIKDGSLHSP